MKRLKTFEDFEYALKQKPIPKPNEELMLSRLQAMANKRIKWSKTKIILVTAIMLTITVPSFVYGENLIKQFIYSYEVITSTSIKDKEGKVTLDYSLIKPDEGIAKEMDDVKLIYDEYAYIIYKHQNELKDDEKELFLIVDAYKINGSFKILEKKQRITSINDVLEKSSFDFKFPNEIPDKYRFKYGSITCSTTGNFYDVSKLYNRALTEGKKYITQKIKTSDETTEIMLVYAHTSGKSEIEIKICPIEKKGVYTDAVNEADDVKVEILDINGHEVLYKAYKASLREMIFVDYNGTKNIAYQITYPKLSKGYSDMTPHVVKMIESMFLTK